MSETPQEWTRRLIEERGYMPAHKVAEVKKILADQHAEDLRRETRRATVEGTWTRRAYLMMAAMTTGASSTVAAEAVATTALAHPEWDMDEKKTWEQWEQG